MSQNSVKVPESGTISGLDLAITINLAHDTLASNFMGASQPNPTYPSQWWADTASGWMKQRNTGDTAWIKRFPLGSGARLDIASASTVDLDATAVTSDYLRVTGTNTISAITLADGQRRIAEAGGAFQLTNSSSLLVQGAANYTTTVGDVLWFIGGPSGVVRVLIFKANGTAIVAASSTVDSVARDQIALTNIRLLLQTAITTGALVQGKQWELATDEWGATSTNETYNAPGSFGYYSNPSGYSTDLIPVMTSNTTPSGTASSSSAMSGYNEYKAFDKIISEPSRWVSNTGTTGWLAYDFGMNKTITKYTLSCDGGGVTPAQMPSAWTFDGWNGSSWVTLDSRSSQTGWGAETRSYTFINSTGYQKYRVNVTANNGNGNMGFTELSMMEAVASSNITLIPPSSVSVSSPPSYMDAYFLYKDDSGSAVLGTDLTVELSRDNGTTYTAATITTLASYDGTYGVIKARADVSGQPSGTSMMCRIKTLNTKAQRIAAPAIYAE